jgi:RNA polymerase sigma-70 factor (ECF subfamily)
MEVEKLGDEELVEHVRTEDQEAYAEVVKRYQMKLLRYAESLVGDGQMAEDVVQEAFIKVYKNLRGFNVKKKFSSWIYRIVHNEAINELKREKRFVSLEANRWVDEKYDNGENVEGEFSKGEIKKMVGGCLKKLPIKYREPVVLFYLEEKSYEEIGDILRMPVGTVGTRMRRGKKILRKLCKGGEVYA